MYTDVSGVVVKQSGLEEELNSSIETDDTTLDGSLFQSLTVFWKKELE